LGKALIGKKVQPPFYEKVTLLTERFMRGGIPDNEDLALVTLPPGTVLFRALKIPNEAAGVDPRLFYRDFLGDPEGRDNVCMNSTHNTFFYPFPYVAFGADQVGQDFDMMIMVVLVHPVNVVCSISPSQSVRGTAKAFTGDAPFQRCDGLVTKIPRCHPLTEKEKEDAQWDNCLNPKYQVASGTRGWMAIAQRDALNTKVVREWGKAGAPKKETYMWEYMNGLKARHPDICNDLLASSYTDHNKNNGFPEIVLYPFKTHLGEKPYKQKCSSVATAIRLMQKEAEKDNFNYLPVAAFTKDGVIDMVNGFFTQETLGLSANAFSTSAASKQPAIESVIKSHMEKLQTQGIVLPSYGPGALSFDTRTGFYILPQVVPRSLAIVPGEEAAPFAKKQGPVPYSRLCIPLANEADKRRVTNYKVMFRNFSLLNFMKNYGIETKFGLNRAMIFDRPPVLSVLFKLFGLGMPKEFIYGLKRATATKAEDEDALKKLGQAASSLAASAAAPAVAPGSPGSPAYAPTTPTGVTPPGSPGSPGSPAYAPTTPTGVTPSGSPGSSANAQHSVRFEEARQKLLGSEITKQNIIGGFGKPVNPFGLRENEIKELQNTKTPESPKYVPLTPRKQQGGTRKVAIAKTKTKTKGRKTAKKQGKTLYHVVSSFHKVWASHGKN
jgi:hypothetical protein